jgi:hypothetical protein
VAAGPVPSRSVTQARTRTVGSFVAGTGIAHVVLVFVGSAVIGGTSGAGRHSLDASTADVADYIARADATRVWVGEFVALLGYALFVLFAAYAWSVVRRAGELDWRDGSVVGSALVYVALALTGTACLAPVLVRGDAEIAAGFLDLRTVLFATAFVFLAFWLVGVGIRSLQTRALPAWLAWAAVAIGVLQLAGTPLAPVDLVFTGPQTFAGFLWIAIASVLFARRERSATRA